MSLKKVLTVTLGGTAIAGLSGMNGLEKGLEIGVKLGFVAGTAVGVIGSTICVIGKKKYKEKKALNA